MEECQKKTPFGLAMREKFLLDKETTFLNHGSYGCVPQEVAEAQNR